MRRRRGLPFFASTTTTFVAAISPPRNGDIPHFLANGEGRDAGGAAAARSIASRRMEIGLTDAAASAAFSDVARERLAKARRTTSERQKMVLHFLKRDLL